MSKTIKEVYDADPTNRNDPSLEGLIPADDGSNGPTTYHIDQLASAVEFRIDQPLQGNLIVTVPDNTLTANIRTVSGITYTHYIITVDDATQPVYPTNFLPAPHALTKDLAAWGTSEVWRMWLYDLSSQTLHPEITDPAGVSGVTVAPNATAHPVISGQFSIGSNTATTASSIVVSATVIDGLTIQYDIVDTYDNNIGYESDVSVGAVTIDGLSPLTTYGFAERASPAGDLTRAAFSNVVEITTDAIGTITALSFTEVEDTTDVIIATFSVSDAELTEWYWDFVDVAPIASSSWLTPLPTPTSTTIDVVNYGAHNIYVWVRDPNFPTSISPSNTAVATASESSPSDSVFGFEATTIGVSEEGQEDIPLVINRGNTTSGTATVYLTLTDGTDGESAISDTHYYNVSQTVSFDSAEASVTVNIPIMFRNLGHINGTPKRRWFTATLSDPSGSNTVNSNADESTISIYGLHKTVSAARIGGYHTNAQIDTNHPPIDLPVTTGSTRLSTGSTTISLRRYDGQKAVDNTVEIASGVTNLTLKDVIIDNANLSGILTMGTCTNLKIINSVFRDWGQSYPTYTTRNAAFHANDAGRSQAVHGTELLGCRADGPGNFSFFWYNTQENRLCWNYFKNTYNYVAGVSPEHGSLMTDTQDGRLISIFNGAGERNHDIIGNVAWTPEGPVRRGCMLDTINFGGGTHGSQESHRTFVLRNWLIGSGVSNADHDTSNFGIILEWNVNNQSNIDSTQGYHTWQFNTLTRPYNGGLQYTNASQMIIQQNDVFCPEVARDCTENGVALNPGGAGSNNYMRWNNLLLYQWDPDGTMHLSHVWTPPNTTHTPTGLNTLNPTMTAWDNGNGQTIVDGRHLILNNPGYDHGIDCLFAETNTPAGNGVLFWEDGVGSGIGQLSFAAYGDTYGPPADIAATTSQSGIGDWEAWYEIDSGANQNAGIKVIIDPTTLAAVGADKYYPVKVTTALVTEYHVPPYDQDIGYDAADAFIGEWAGTETVTGSAPDNTPDVPTSFADTPGAATITFDWDDMSSSGATSYRLYEDSVLVASPLSGDYTGYIHTPPDSDSHNYQLASADDTASPALTSAKTSPISSQLTGLYTALEDWDHGDWSTSNLASVVDQGDGTWLFTNGTSATTGAKFDHFTGLVSGHTYRIRFKHKNGSAGGRWLAVDASSGLYWALPESTGYHSSNLDNPTLTQIEKDITLTGTILTLVFWGGVSNTRQFDVLQCSDI